MSTGATSWISNGYNERIVTYGYEDDDLFERLERAGLTRRDVDLDTVHHIPHDDLARTRHQDVVNVQAETARNKALAHSDPWSPADRMTGLDASRNRRAATRFTSRPGRAGRDRAAARGAGRIAAPFLAEAAIVRGGRLRDESARLLYRDFWRGFPGDDSAAIRTMFRALFGGLGLRKPLLVRSVFSHHHADGGADGWGPDEVVRVAFSGEAEHLDVGARRI